jgi:peptidoglycan/LPS O-acetylase OafA/YrhL
LWLGRISYSVYLVHIPVLYLVFRAITRWDEHIGGWEFLALALPGTLLVTIALAAFTYRFIERPGMGWGRQLANPRRPLGPVSLVGRA